MERPHDARDVEEVTVVQVVGNAVASPGAATHRKRERQRVVEASAGRKAMRLVDDDAANRKRKPELDRTPLIPAVQSDRMARSLIAEESHGKCCSFAEIGCAIERQHRGQLFARKGMAWT